MRKRKKCRCNEQSSPDSIRIAEARYWAGLSMRLMNMEDEEEALKAVIRCLHSVLDMKEND